MFKTVAYKSHLSIDIFKENTHIKSINFNETWKRLSLNKYECYPIERVDKPVIDKIPFSHVRNAAVDLLISEWKDVLPDHDLLAKQLTARISRIDHLLINATSEILQGYSLIDTEFRLLAGLRRSGPPFQQSPSEISPRYVPVTSGGLTGLLNRLEQRALVKRTAHPTDRRSVIVHLTKKGKNLIEKAMTAVAEMESKVTEELTEEEYIKGVELMQKLLRAAQNTLGEPM